MSATPESQFQQSDATGSARVAVIDRDSGFVTVVRRRAEAIGWKIRDLDHVPAVDTLVEMRLHAMIIDPTLIGPQWVETIEYVRSNLRGVVLIVVTGPSSVGQRVRGLRAGADDWMTKPCHPEEVIARVEASMRRSRTKDQPTAEPVVAGEIVIRTDQFQAFHEGRSIDLTRREFELLQLLAENEGKVLEREEIYQRVWGYRMAHGDRSVDVFVRKLRQKIEQQSPSWEYIHTHFGVGYRFAAEPRTGDNKRRSKPAKSDSDEPAPAASKSRRRAAVAAA
jgi:DNA-binding response OmpR family regulator